MSVLSDFEEFLESLDKGSEQKVFEDLDLKTVWEFVKVSEILLGGNAVELIGCPEVVEIVFDLSGKFLFQNSSMIILL